MIISSNDVISEEKVSAPPVTGMVSLIVPTYNERSNVYPLVKRIHEAMSGLAGHDYEIVLVDDDSPDGTARAADELSDEYPIRVVVRPNKRGLASAVIDGFSYARGDILGIIDADLQHPPEVVPGLITAIDEGAEVVIASRYVEGGGVPEWGLVRRVISKGAITLAHLLLPGTRRVKDPMSGCFLFRRELLEGNSLEPIGYKILLEILATRNVEKITEVPYTFANRDSGESKLGIKTQLDYLKHLASLMRRSGEAVRFLKFCLVGLSGVGVNMGLLWLLVSLAGMQYLFASAISIETSIITNFLFNNYFTFYDRRSSAFRLFFRRLLQFNAVSLAGLAINMTVLFIFTSVFGVYYLLSNIIGIALATLWNFLLNSWWTWRSQPESRD